MKVASNWTHRKEQELIRRMVGAIKLRRETFEEVEADPSATKQAMLVVITVALATGIGALGAGGLLGLAIGVIIGLLGWGAWALITFVTGTTLLRTPATEANWGQLAGALGFA